MYRVAAFVLPFAAFLAVVGYMALHTDPCVSGLERPACLPRFRGTCNHPRGWGDPNRTEHFLYPIADTAFNSSTATLPVDDRWLAFVVADIGGRTSFLDCEPTNAHVKHRYEWWLGETRNNSEQARAYACGEIQAFLYNVWLPTVLDVHVKPACYSQNVDPRALREFVAVANVSALLPLLPAPRYWEWALFIANVTQPRVQPAVWRALFQRQFELTRDGDAYFYLWDPAVKDRRTYLHLATEDRFSL